MRVDAFSSEGAWIEAAIGELRDSASLARSEGRAALSLCLAGGLTPEPVYRAMAALPLDGPAVELWLGDERIVPADDPARNGVMAARAFSACAWDPSPRLRLWPDAATEAAALSASDRYEAELRASLGSRPCFDLAFLGLGADGHTASLFPGSALLLDDPHADEAPRLSALARSPIAPFGRMTLTLDALRRARRRIFLVKGRDKLAALRRLADEDAGIPAARLAGPGALVLYLGSYA